jgi:cobalamin-dependent methionine synthase I
LVAILQHLGVEWTIPEIFDHEHYGSEAKKLFADAQVLLKRIIAESTLRANAIVAVTCQ